MGSKVSPAPEVEREQHQLILKVEDELLPNDLDAFHYYFLGVLHNVGL